MTSQEFARSLRLVADWYDMHSDMPTLSELRIYHVEETREEAARIARALMPVDKQAESEMFTLSRPFGAQDDNPRNVQVKGRREESPICQRRIRPRDDRQRQRAESLSLDSSTAQPMGQCHDGTTFSRYYIFPHPLLRGVDIPYLAPEHNHMKSSSYVGG